MDEAGRAREELRRQPEFPSADTSLGIVPPATTCAGRAVKMKVFAQ